MKFPKKVKIVEVGPRDGLQNEKQVIDLADKIDFINQLSDTGLPVIEVGSFVSPKWVPQLADSAEVFKGIHQREHIHYPVLVPNEAGLDKALEIDVKEISVFTTPSELFSKKNTNCTVKESLERIAKVIKKAADHKLFVRGYVSCVLGCPYEGNIDTKKVQYICNELWQMGCGEISLGDTIGVGTPENTRGLIQSIASCIPLENLAVHFHDTYGMAIANIYAALLEGIHIVDASIAGLGGCPYAKGASGNVATEDVVYLLNGMGIETGVNLQKLISVGQFISRKLNRENKSKVSNAMHM